MPSDHGVVKEYTRSPLASSARRSSDTAPCAVYRIKRSNWSRRCAGIWVLACRENPLTLAQRGPVSSGRSPAYPHPEPIRRTCCPARSPQAMRGVTDASGLERVRSRAPGSWEPQRRLPGRRVSCFSQAGGPDDSGSALMLTGSHALWQPMGQSGDAPSVQRRLRRVHMAYTSPTAGCPRQGHSALAFPRA